MSNGFLFVDKMKCFVVVLVGVLALAAAEDVVGPIKRDRY